jgi:hypothetical protein
VAVLRAFCTKWEEKIWLLKDENMVKCTRKAKKKEITSSSPTKPAIAR